MKKTVTKVAKKAVTKPKRVYATKYKPELCELVIRLGKEGASKTEMACDCGISRETMNQWEEKHNTWVAAQHFKPPLKTSSTMNALVSRRTPSTHGSLKASDAIVSTLYAIIEERTTMHRRTIWTSNETLEKMLQGDRLSHEARSRIISRIGGYSEIVTF